MAGFLSHLAARALGEVPLAEPLTPARFTPGKDPGAGIDFISEHEAVPARTSENHQHANLRNTREFAKDPQIRPPEDRSDRQRSDVHFASVLPSPALPVQEGSRRELPEDPLQRSRSVPRFPLPSESEPRDALNPSIRSGEERVPEVMRAARPAAAPFAEAAMVPREEKRPPGPLPTQRSLLAEQTSSPAPVVRVTIGRIDVRAEPANAPAAPVARPRTPTVSLDQFLKQRSAGKR